MPSFYSTAIVLASASLALAAPPMKRGAAVRINQVKAGTYVKNGPADIVKTHGKYKSTAPSNVVKAAQAQQGSVSANPQANDEAYLCPVTIGGQTLNLDFDTGSSDLWVFSTETPSSESAGHTLYNPSESGQQLQGYTWSISYGDGSSSSGNVFDDSVSVGSVTAASQAVEAATQVSSQFAQNTATDGLLGLAFSSINQVQPQQQTTFFDTVKSSLSTPVFTADLKKGQAGSYDFGYIDNSKYTGSITYTPVDNSQGFWGFTANDASAGGQDLGSVGGSIMDTGTSLLYLPSSVVSAYYSQISDAQNNSQAGGYTLSCSDTPPDFSVSIGGTTFTLPGSYIIYAPIDQSGQTCFGGIQVNTGLPQSIFGDVFMKNFFVVFDPNGPQLGIANQ